ncbi:MAG: PQQ-dependent sugar dehydrogenase, partial [Bacteroidota bacterium]
LFVVQQEGIVKILNADGTTNATSFLDVSAMISTGGERGLLGLAFHPDYATNGYFYIDYTNTAGNTVIARYTRTTGNENTADPSSAEILLTITQPFDNHNGGCLHFGPDGYLYIAMGDGGSGGDPNNNGQSINTLLGKLLRIDVDGASPYSSPADNPYVGVDGADEIWATGLRNPWKFSFNRLNGDLWIADVGQGEVEEINKATDNPSGINYGWRCFEGSVVFNSDNCSLVEMYTPPFAEYTHTETGGCSITGGYVYTGDSYPALQGKYIFADYCNNKIGIAAADGTLTYTEAFGGNFSTFGQDTNGELYIAGKNSGIIHKITDSTAGIIGFENNMFSMYPNPAGNEITVNLAVDSANLFIYDISGKTVMSNTLASGNNSINTSSLQAGLYIVAIEHSKGSSKQKLLIY